MGQRVLKNGIEADWTEWVERPGWHDHPLPSMAIHLPGSAFRRPRAPRWKVAAAHIEPFSPSRWSDLQLQVSEEFTGFEELKLYIYRSQKSFTGLRRVYRF